MWYAGRLPVEACCKNLLYYKKGAAAFRAMAPFLRTYKARLYSAKQRASRLGKNLPGSALAVMGKAAAGKTGGG